MDRLHDGLVLIGPTGSGKSPLGDALQQYGLAGRHCLHFDFGENLRHIAALGRPNDIVTQDDIQFVQRVLREGLLLEDGDFPLAERIIRSFLAEHHADPHDLLVFNGLPRHVGQAESLAAVVRVRYLVVLDCTAECVQQRIAQNTGGDRTGRLDDDVAAIHRKLKIYAQRTKPLVEYYRQRHVPIIHVPVTVGMTAMDAWKIVNRLMSQIT